MVIFRIGNLKLVNKLHFYLGYLVSGFVNGGSWKLERITELTAKEKRRILIRNMSTYEELFSRQEQRLNANP
ncbi:hypothetical protein Psch_03896 [Pelotomaculum schinkii]|uniref:Uncharacterized protein n=1 Tax=Pelotomaculum schinkii TaxID=78350 RepID=A0A4Y7R6B0_9FIRM|nr:MULTISPECIES: hypothetical protein [Pelotomaculum]TEB04171.1 hypothetical protein Psch_03896 [Pelotomaculum schinkii]TEB17801.1 hypothetical protein Psfp_00293 [Pelotomaculum sp. FP]